VHASPAFHLVRLIFTTLLNNNEQVCFSCDSVQLASRLVQDMAQCFGITALSCEADFPKDAENLRQLLAQVADYNSNRVKLSTDMADMCNMVKERVVKAEDCRIILDIARARSAYVEIQDINLKLRQQYTKREANHQQLLACLKEISHHRIFLSLRRLLFVFILSLT
jgi:Bardet-Biedl syndrome 2 protein